MTYFVPLVTDLGARVKIQYIFPQQCNLFLDTFVTVNKVHKRKINSSSINVRLRKILNIKHLTDTKL